MPPYNSMLMTKFKFLEIETFESTDGAKLVVEDFGGHGDNLLFVHATGFCARMYLPIAMELREQFHCWGINARYHGGSSGTNGTDLNWNVLASDILEVTRHLGPGPWRGFGHSYGGAGLLLAEEAQPRTFTSLFLYEPVVTIEQHTAEPNFDSPLSKLTRKRRQSFATRFDAVQNFSSKLPMQAFDPLVMDLYLEAGFRRGLDGHLHLACAREIEAQVYAWASCHNAYSEMDRVACDTLMVAGETTDAFNADHLGRIAAKGASSRVMVAPGLGHFGPFEDPVSVAGMIKDFL